MEESPIGDEEWGEADGIYLGPLMSPIVDGEAVDGMFPMPDEKAEDAPKKRRKDNPEVAKQRAARWRAMKQKEAQEREASLHEYEAQKRPEAYATLGGLTFGKDRAPLRPVVVTTVACYPKVDELRRFLDEKYCTFAKDSGAIRYTFGEDIQPEQERRFMWRPVNTTKTLLKRQGYEPLRDLMAYVDAAFMHLMVNRERGECGRGLLPIDTGDCTKTHSLAPRCVKHRDYDKGRGNSYAVLLFIGPNEDGIGLCTNAQGGEKKHAYAIRPIRHNPHVRLPFRLVASRCHGER